MQAQQVDSCNSQSALRKMIQHQPVKRDTNCELPGKLTSRMAAMKELQGFHGYAQLWQWGTIASASEFRWRQSFIASRMLRQSSVPAHHHKCTVDGNYAAIDLKMNREAESFKPTSGLALHIQDMLQVMQCCQSHLSQRNTATSDLISSRENNVSFTCQPY